MKGMFNKMLRINLSENKITEFRLADEILHQYLGGRGLGVKLFTDAVKPETDPYSPQNTMVFAVGPETGTKIPTSSRFSLVTKSPLTQTIFYSDSGGEFAVYIKKCGLDGFMVEGKAAKPSYILIDGENTAFIKDASPAWGLDSEKSMAWLEQEEGLNTEILLIGPAGENLVRLSSIMNNGGRAFGRGGVGAVMGSKNLKAIVIKKGKGKAGIHDEKLLDQFVKSAFDKIKVSPITRAGLPEFGTAGLVNIMNDLGMFPIENFSKGYSPEAVKVNGEAIRKHLLKKKEGCFGCPINCGRVTEAGNMKGLGPEYESLWALGPDCGIFDLEAIAQANYHCNLYGLDTISVGSTIACAMEMQKNGILNEPGFNFGNAEILIPLIKKIAMREGIGAELAEGSKRFAEKFHAPDSSMQVKGMEIVAYDPRGAMGHALGYATSNRGGCHLSGYMAAMEILAAPKKIDRFTLGGKPDLLALKQNQSAVEDSLVCCKFLGFAVGFDFHARFVSLITGEDFNISKLLEIGERIYNLERIFNVKSGFSRPDDNLPKRFLETALEEGLSAGHVVPLKQLIDGYYAVRKWDENGIPTHQITDKLGLSEYASR